MKLSFNKPLTAAVLVVSSLCFAATSCGKEDPVEALDTPEILFVHSPLSVDLNLSTMPEIISVVNSRTGLARIETFILKTGDVEEPFEEPITSFFNPNSHSINYTPVYTEDMEGFKVVVTDLAGQRIESVLPFEITPLRNPPSVVFNDGDETISYLEGDPMPTLVVRVSSEEELRTFTLKEVVDRVETIIQIGGEDMITFAAGTYEYTFDFADDGYRFTNGITALKATVEAGPETNLKTKTTTLYVDITYLAAPVVTVAQTDPTVNEFATLTLTGTISSESGLRTVNYYTRTAGRDTEIEGTAESFDTAIESHNFSIEYPNASTDVTAIVIVATDELGKTTTHVQPITVRELAPAPVIAIDQADESFNGVSASVSTLSLTGSVTSGDQLVEVTVTTTNMAGVKTPKTITIGSGQEQNLPLDESIAVAEDLAMITITATDGNNKTTVKEIPVYVGFKYLRLLASGNGSDNYSTPTSCFFSAQLQKTLGYTQETVDNADKMNIAFATWDSGKQLNVASITCTDLGTKLNHPTYGKDKWLNPVPVATLLRTAANIKRSNFDQATISDIMAETAPTGIGSRVQLTADSMEAPNNVAILYITEIDGVDKRVVVCYDVLDTQSPEGNATASTFWIKVKIEL